MNIYVWLTFSLNCDAFWIDSMKFWHFYSRFHDDSPSFYWDIPKDVDYRYFSPFSLATVS